MAETRKKPPPRRRPEKAEPRTVDGIDGLLQLGLEEQLFDRMTHDPQAVDQFIQRKLVEDVSSGGVIMDLLFLRRQEAVEALRLFRRANPFDAAQMAALQRPIVAYMEVIEWLESRIPFAGTGVAQPPSPD